MTDRFDRKLTLMEELLLLALHDEKGTFLNSSTISYGLSAAALIELSLRDRVQIEEKFLKLFSKEPTGDAILDQVMEALREAKRRRKTKDWVRVLPGKVKKLEEQVADRLVDRGILKFEERKVLLVFTARRYPERSPGPEKEIRTRIRRAVKGSRIPDQRTAALAALMGACRLTKHVFEKGERRDANRRVKEIMKSDRFARAVGEVIKEIESAVAAAVAVSAATS